MEKKTRKKLSPRLIYGLLVSLALAAGLLAPLAVRRIGDARVERQNEDENAFIAREEYEVDPGLTLPEKLRLAGDGDFIGPFARIGGRTEEEMRALDFPAGTLETVRLFYELWYDEKEAEIALENIGMVHAESYYARLGDPEKGFANAVVWRCRFIDGKGNVTWLVIDDVTEEVLAFRLIVRDPEPGPGDGTAAKTGDLPSGETIRDFAEEVLSPHFAPYGVEVESAGREDGYGLWTLTVSDGSESAVCLLEILESDRDTLIVNFNNCRNEW